MGTSFIINGTYGKTTVIYDTTVRNYFATVPAQSQEVVTSAGVLTTLGQGLYDVLSPYMRSLEYTALHNLSSGEFDFSIYAHRLELLVNKVTISSIFPVFDTPELFSSASTNAYIKFVSYRDPGYIFYPLISVDASTWSNTLLGYPYGLACVSSSPDSRYKDLSISLCACNDDGSQPRLISLSTGNTLNNVLMVRSPSDSFATIFPEWIRGVPEWKDNADPYNPGRTSTHGGGGRSFDDSSDPVDIPPVPVDPVLNSGFVSLYKMDTMKLMDLATFMWDTNLFDVSAWQKVMANPFDAIISLKYVPANPNTLPNPAPIKIGNVQTNVSAPVVSQQYVQIQCGTLDVEEYSGSYLDYSPYTKVEIYLPFIGFRELNTDEVMDKTLTLTYNVDVLSGSCVANIKVGDTVLYQFAGECAMDIPITGRDSGKTLAGILGVIASAGSAVGGAIAGVLNPESAVKGVTAAADSVIGGKRNIQRSGNVTGSAGFMGGQTPYLIITRPRQALPEEQNLYMGYPSFITSLLDDLSGMTIVADCHLENIPCTDGELQEIERLLKEGVLL